MPKVLTVRYERSFAIPRSTLRETLSATVAADADDPESGAAAMKAAVDLVYDTREMLQREREPVIRANRFQSPPDLASRFAEAVDMCVDASKRANEAERTATDLRVALRYARTSLEALARIETPDVLSDLGIAARSTRGSNFITAGEVRQAKCALAELNRVEEL